MGAISKEHTKKRRVIDGFSTTLKQRNASSAREIRAFFKLLWGPTSICFYYDDLNGKKKTGMDGMLQLIKKAEDDLFSDPLTVCFEFAENLWTEYKTIDGYSMLAERYFTGRRKAAKILSEIVKKDRKTKDKQKAKGKPVPLKEIRKGLIKDFSEEFESSLRSGHSICLEIYSDLLGFLGRIDIVKKGLERERDGEIDYWVKPDGEARKKVILYCSISLILHGNKKEREMGAKALSELPNNPRTLSRTVKKPNPYAGKKQVDIIKMVKEEMKEDYIE